MSRLDDIAALLLAALNDEQEALPAEKPVPRQRPPVTRRAEERKKAG